MSMNILFVHQNFPAQYRHLAPALVSRGHRVVVLTLSGHAQLDAAEVVQYKLTRGNTPSGHPLVTEFESKVIRGEAAAARAAQLKADGFYPDVICGHPGWGETLFLKDIWPEAKFLAFLEFFYHFRGADVNFDPEFQDHEYGSAARLRVKNANNLLALQSMDMGICPTQWQRSLYPPWCQDRIKVVHDGVDTRHLCPNPNAVLRSESAGLEIKAGEEIITYVSRTLEPCRGFHQFMRSLPAVLAARPKARVLIVGGDGPGYGPTPVSGRTWREQFVDEIKHKTDMSRVLFLGHVPYAVYVAVLQVSAVHVYFTYPFVLSWSMMEAMSTGCLVVGSDTAPVSEVVSDGFNGVLVNFFDSTKLSNAIINALQSPSAFLEVRQRARDTIVQKYDLESVCLPQHIALVESLAGDEAQPA